MPTPNRAPRRDRRRPAPAPAKTPLRLILATTYAEYIELAPVVRRPRAAA